MNDETEMERIRRLYGRRHMTAGTRQMTTDGRGGGGKYLDYERPGLSIMALALVLKTHGEDCPEWRFAPPAQRMAAAALLERAEADQ
jgi:hypothetical protein